MKHLKRLSWVAPYAIILALLYGGTAQAASHQPALDGLIAYFQANLDGLIAYLSEL